MAASHFVEVYSTDKEISEIKINSVPKNTKDLCKNTKTIIRLRLGDYRHIGQYSPRLRLGEYLTIIRRRRGDSFLFLIYKIAFT
jgi:hypothetical protein